MWLVDTFDNMEQYLQQFVDAETIGEFNGLTLKKRQGEVSIHYGLFDGETLVAYYWLNTFKSHYKLLHGFELRIAEPHQRKGIAMFFYHHIVVVEGNWIVSDYSHNIPSANIWDKMMAMPEYVVVMYDRRSDLIQWHLPVDNKLVYANDYMHLVVMPTVVCAR